MEKTMTMKRRTKTKLTNPHGVEPLLRDVELLEAAPHMTLKMIRADRLKARPVIPFIRLGRQYRYLVSAVNEALREASRRSVEGARR
jgi:hypothetical protein